MPVRDLDLCVPFLVSSLVLFFGKQHFSFTWHINFTALHPTTARPIFSVSLSWLPQTKKDLLLIVWLTSIFHALIYSGWCSLCIHFNVSFGVVKPHKKKKRNQTIVPSDSMRWQRRFFSRAICSIIQHCLRLNESMIVCAEREENPSPIGTSAFYQNSANCINK